MLSDNSLDLVVSKPPGWLKKAVKLDYKAFFKAVGKAALKGLLGKWVEALSEVPDLVAALGLDTKPEERAWILIRRALARAVIILLQEYSEAQRLESPRTEPELDSHAYDEPTSFVLSSDFFEHPESSEIVPKTRPAFAHWLQQLGLPEARARNIADRLGSYFALAVHNEWRSNPDFYQPVREALVSPFSKAVEREFGWRRYRTFLENRPDEPVFGESFSLRQIYVEPRGYFIDKILGAPKISKNRRSNGQTEERRHVVLLLPHLLDCITSCDRDLCIRVLSGGPGSGKSSLARVLAARLAAREELEVVFVPLYKIDTKLDLKGAVGSLLQEEGFLTENPLEVTGGKRVILILDGLDELEMQGKEGQEVAQAFIREVVRTVDRVNPQERRLQVIITGRELAVQAIETEFRKTGQVLHVLPYYVPDKGRYHDPENHLAADQREIWWQKYGCLTDSGYTGTPSELKKGEIGEVTAQPLLNYLVALSYRRGGLDLSGQTNLNAIYGDLVRAVYERGWAPRYHPAIRNLTEDTFFRLLEEVALAVWHGDGRTTTLREIEEHCRESNVLNLLPALEQGASSGISALLLAFYFRQKGRRTDGDKTFEFTHKSFGEYLTALRIVRQVAQTSQKMAQAKARPDSGWEHDETLYRWLSICGTTTMDEYLAEFVRRELALRAGTAKKAQRHLAELYQALLTRGWPMNRFPALKFIEQQRWAINAEQAMFACINACARVTKRQTKIEWQSTTAFGTALKRMQGQRQGLQVGLTQSCLSYLNLDGCVLNTADLFKADLSHSSLRRAHLVFAVLVGADLTDADLKSAFLLGVNLEAATLTNANFEDARLGGDIQAFLQPQSARWRRPADVMNALTRRGARGTPQITGLSFHLGIRGEGVFFTVGPRPFPNASPPVATEPPGKSASTEPAP